MRVLEKEQLFRSITGAETLDCTLLQSEAIVVLNYAEPSSFAYSTGLSCLCNHREA